MGKLQTILQELNKKYGEGTMLLAKDFKPSKISRLSSGSLLLDKALGQSMDKTIGWPMGRIIEVYGPTMSGKTSMTMKTIVEAQKVLPKRNNAFFDAEKSFDLERARNMGVDVDNLFYTTETMGEKVLETICDLLKTREFAVIVVDSLASLIPQAELEKSMMESNRMALSAQMMSQGMRKLTYYLKDELVIFINQLRSNPGQKYGSPEYTPGGSALKYYSSVRLDFRKKEPIVAENKQIIGQVVKFKVAKNKTAPPLRDGEFNFMFDGSIDQVDELISVGLLSETIKRKGVGKNTLYFLNEDITFKKREEMYHAFKDDADLFEKAKAIVLGV